MADDDVHAGSTRDFHDCPALVESERHRLLDKKVLAILGSKRGMSGMALMWGSHIDRLDSRVGAQLLDGCAIPGGEVRRKLLPRFAACVGGRTQREPPVARKRRHHHAKCATKPCHAETELTFACANHRQGPAHFLVLS